MKHSYLYILSFLLILFCCTKEEAKINDTKSDELPQASHTGAHTLGFYLNDQLWLPSQTCTRNCEELTSYYSALTFKNGEKVPYYNIYTKRVTGRGSTSEQLLEMQIMRLTRTGKYSLHNNILASLEELASYAVLTENSPSVGKRLYVSDSTKTPFIVTITSIDFLNNTTSIPIVAGTFEGVLYNRENPQDSLIIKRGRFDLKE